jgi:hypothetical protein
MIVESIQHVVNNVKDSYQTKIYKTLEDPVTMQSIVACEIYTRNATVEKMPDKGSIVDKKV